MRQETATNALEKNLGNLSSTERTYLFIVLLPFNSYLNLKLYFLEQEMISATNVPSSKTRKEPTTMIRKRANMQTRISVL